MRWAAFGDSRRVAKSAKSPKNAKGEVAARDFGPTIRSLPISAAVKTGPSSNYGFGASATKTKLPQPEMGLKFGHFIAEARGRKTSRSEIVNGFLADEASNRLIKLQIG